MEFCVREEDETPTTCAAKRLFIHKNILQYKLRKPTSISTHYNMHGT